MENVDSTKTKIYLWPSIAFALGFCSLNFEFICSQLNSVLLGHTGYRYALSISLYIFGLGIGALIFEFLPKKFDRRAVFLGAELGLSAVGLFAPLVYRGLFALDSFSHLGLEMFGVLATLCTGALSGIEVPAIFWFNKRIATVVDHKILAADYGAAVLVGPSP